MKAFNAFKDYSPVQKHVIDVFLADERNHGPQGSFHLYFDENWQSSRWNQIVVSEMSHAIQVAAGKLTGKHQLEGELSREEIEAYLWDYLKQSQDSWGKDRCRVHESGERMETHDEASQRARNYLDTRGAVTWSTSRKHHVSTSTNVSFFQD